MYFNDNKKYIKGYPLCYGLKLKNKFGKKNFKNF